MLQLLCCFPQIEGLIQRRQSRYFGGTGDVFIYIFARQTTGSYLQKRVHSPRENNMTIDRTLF
jgi:hypothetical protein